MRKPITALKTMSPSSFRYSHCDTISMQLDVILWYNIQPRHNDKLHIAVSEKMPYRTRVQCSYFQFQRLYYFFGEKVYLDKNFEEPDQHSSPDAIAGEYLDIRKK